MFYAIGLLGTAVSISGAIWKFKLQRRLRRLS
jgi:hypothetical protein